MIYDYTVFKGNLLIGALFHDRDQARTAMLTRMYLLEPDISYIHMIDNFMWFAKSGVAYVDPKGYTWVYFEASHCPGSFIKTVNDNYSGPDRNDI